MAIGVLGEGGGVVYVADGEYTLEDSVADKFVTLAGPIEVVGISSNAANVVIKRGTAAGRLFTLNHAGAALRYLTLQGGISKGDDVQGGNVYIGSAGGTVECCILKNGRTDDWGDEGRGGGNIFMESGLCTGCEITGGGLGNIRSWGSGAYLRGDAVMENCLLYGNADNTHSGNYSGGTVRLDGSAKIIHSTIVGNSHSCHAGLYFGSNSARAINCVIAGNSVVYEVDDPRHAGTDVLPNTCYNANAGSAMAACLVNCASDADARFSVPNETVLTVSSADFADAANGDWRLSNTSVCRDAGVAESGIHATRDLNGNPRVIGSNPDIGCFELVASFYIVAEASKCMGQLPDEAVITFRTEAYYASGEVTYTWNFGDGTTLTTSETEVSHAYTTHGIFDVSVVATSGSETHIYEFETPISIYELECGFVASASPVILVTPYTFSVVDVHSPETITYTWNFGDGTSEVTTEESVSHTYANVGTYTVSVVAATPNSGSISYTFETPMGVVGRDLYVRASGGSNTYPYDTPAKATAKPQTALDAAVDGCVIHLAPGRYEQSHGIGETIVSKGVTLVGDGATPEATILTGYTGNSGVRNLRVNHPNACVHNLTLENAFSGSSPGGGNLLLYNGTVSNCVLRGGHTRNSGADSGGARVVDGLLTHCVITNSAHGNRGSAIVMNQSGGRVSNCLIGYNKLLWDTTRNAAHLVYVSGGTIENCSIVGGRILKNDPERPMQMGKNSDKGVYVGPNAKAINVAIADLKYTSYDADKVAAFEAEYVRDWEGTAASFVNCATDDPTPINDSCRIGTPESFFADYAAGNLLPKLGSPLSNKGTPLPNAPSIDLAGNPRVSGNVIDIGCFENPIDATTIIYFR